MNPLKPEPPTLFYKKETSASALSLSNSLAGICS